MKGLEINGYFTIVENEILDLLLILKLTKYEIKITLAGVRLLNGFGKEKDRIPLSLLTKITRIDKGDCSRAVNSLIKKKMLYKKEGEIGINRDFKQWQGVGDLPTGKGLVKWLKWVGDLGKKGVGDLAPSKETSKETIQIKVLSKKEKKKKREADKKGLKMLKEVLRKGPGNKLRWK